MGEFFLSLGILSYKRTEETLRLLQSIDYFEPDLEVVICEDNSPDRNDIRAMVKDFSSHSPLHIRYFENAKNYGFDGNVREVVRRATGEYLTFMGNDDVVLPGALAKVCAFLKEHRDIGYMLRRTQHVCEDGSIEHFRYYPGTRFFPVGFETLCALYRKSVIISGFTIRREPLLQYMTDRFDGTLLMQLYFLSEIVMQYPSAYFDVPYTQTFPKRGGILFGASDAERGQYIAGEEHPIENSLTFLSKFRQVSDYIDAKYHLRLTDRTTHDMSKYFYPNLAIQRPKGIRTFIRYLKGLHGLGYDCTFYYWIYAFALLIFGKKICDFFIVYLKRKIGYTPKL